MQVKDIHSGYVATPPAIVLEKFRAGHIGEPINMSGTALEDSYDPRFSFLQNHETGAWYAAQWSQSCDRAPPWLEIMDTGQIEKKLLANEEVMEETRARIANLHRFEGDEKQAAEEMAAEKTEPGMIARFFGATAKPFFDQTMVERIHENADSYKWDAAREEKYLDEFDAQQKTLQAIHDALGKAALTGENPEHILFRNNGAVQTPCPRF